MPYYDEGTYRCKLGRQLLAENNHGNPEVQIPCWPLAKMEQDQTETPVNADRPRTVFLTITEGTIGDASRPGWVLLTLQFLGFNGTSFGQLDPGEPNSISFEDKEVLCSCTHNEYNGKTTEKWAIVRPGSQFQGKPAPKKAVRELDAKFSKLLKSHVPAAGTQLAPPSNGTVPPPAAPPPQINDDIPF